MRPEGYATVDGFAFTIRKASSTVKTQGEYGTAEET